MMRVCRLSSLPVERANSERSCSSLTSSLIWAPSSAAGQSEGSVEDSSCCFHWGRVAAREEGVEGGKEAREAAADAGREAEGARSGGRMEPVRTCGAVRGGRRGGQGWGGEGFGGGEEGAAYKGSGNLCFRAG